MSNKDGDPEQDVKIGKSAKTVQTGLLQRVVG